MKACVITLLCLAFAGCHKPPQLSERTMRCVEKSLGMEGDEVRKQMRTCRILAQTDCINDGGTATECLDFALAERHEWQH